MEGNVTITKDEYLDLKRDSAKLSLLEYGGVYTWDFYQEALNPKDGDDFWTIREKLHKEIEEM